MSFYVTKKPDIITKSSREKISNRYHRVTKIINQQYWQNNSDSKHSFYVGSYGRGTAISTGDIDILVELPDNQKQRFTQNVGNSQSQLLQDVKRTLQETFPNSNIHADGQIVYIKFYDHIHFEILPAFSNFDYWGSEIPLSYTYADSNHGGKWLSTRPKQEQAAVKEKNRSSNGLFNATCQHIRNIRDNYYKSYHLAGIVIDSFVFEAIGNWQFSNSGEEPGTYESKLQEYLYDNVINGSLYLIAPGSNQRVETADSLLCLQKVLKRINE